jgi:hypothetical protein
LPEPEPGAEEPLDAEAFNMACFRLSRALGELDFTVPEAAPFARHLLRTVGRIVIDTATEGADAAAWPNTELMALQWVDQALRGLGYQVRPTAEGGREQLPAPEDEWR